MEDFSGFSSTSFDASEWVNRALNVESETETPSADQVDAHLAKLSMRLQLMAQDCGDSLEGVMAEASTVMWRTANDVSSVEKSVASLQTAVQQLSEHIGTNQSRNIAGVDELFRLDIIKRNMEQSRSILVEAAQWHQLVQEARAALGGQANLKAAAEKLEALQRCLKVLKSIPEHSSREAVLEEIKSTLMAKLQPKLQTEIAADDPAQLQELVYVFRILGAEAQASDQYVQRKPVAVSQQWDGLQASPAQGTQFVQEFATICATVQAMMKGEARNTVQLFGSAAAPGLLCAMLKFTLDHQKSGLTSRLKQSGMSSEDMSACFRVTAQMLQDVLPLVQDAQIGDLRPSYIASLEPFLVSQEIFTSKLIARLRDQTRETLALLRHDKLEKSPAAFDDFLGDDEALGGAHTAVIDSFVDVCRTALKPHLQSVLDAANFADGIVSRHHNGQMNQVLAETLQALRQTLQSLRLSAGLQPEDSASDASPQTRAERNLQPNVGSPVGGEGPTSIEQSEFIQTALQVLQGVALLVRQLEQTETAVVAEYTKSYDVLFGANVMTEETHQLVSQISTNDFSKHVFNYLADTKQFGLADVRKFLYQFHSPSADAGSWIAFAPAAKIFHDLRLSSSMLLLDVCLEAPRQLLADMSKLPAWTASSPESSDEHDPFRSTTTADKLPQQLFTQLGERLFSLVDLFMEFAAAEAAGTELDVLKSDPITLQLAFLGWKSLAAQFDSDRRGDIKSLITDYQRTRQAIQAAEHAAFGTSNDAGQRSRATSEASVAAADGHETDFTDQWLRCIADAVLGLVVHQALRIRKLSRSGRAQLVVDLRFLENVFEALSPVRPPLLHHVIRLLDEDVELARKRYNSPVGTNFVRTLENRILALREDFD